MNIHWNHITWYSKLLAVILFVVVFALGWYFGNAYAEATEYIDHPVSLFQPPVTLTLLEADASTTATTTPNIQDKKTAPAASTNTKTPAAVVQPSAPSTTTTTPPTTPITTPVQTQNPAQSTPVQTTPSVVTPAPVSTPASNEIRFTAYTTGYGWPDNTPPGGEVSNPVLHQSAGGTGTYSDPITVAVGHTISGNNDTLDYAEGTKFYVPNLRRYFIVEDTCGDGNKPQNGPCHTGFEGHVWLDLWIGGNDATKAPVLSCEDDVTGLFLVIQNPASNYAVVPGAVYSNSCAAQYGDTILNF